ncbi:GH36-type glycosyl hydrolase domain-containing protein [Pseudooceanicola spongiae]|uniref:GH36-type glycosyl hydrolase domain-containing protein n=1 Tax=Pseudooceanicola spongiae TaxID=2613965 RepID=UPI0021F8035F|nr:glucoamylase family protein [Pseudooceanicola spongiae]
MNAGLHRFFTGSEGTTPWSDIAPVRAELFGFERLEQHAISLAAAQSITARPLRVPSLHRRLDHNAAALLAAWRASGREVAEGRPVVPAAEWLLDNYHLVEAQIREIRTDLPPGYYRLLPKLAAGPFAGYPRVFGLVWAFVAHTDSHFTAVALRRFLQAYQSVQPLTIGELWAVAITLRIVMVENLCRLSNQIIVGRTMRQEADALADLVLMPGRSHNGLSAALACYPDVALPEGFASQLAKRLRDSDPVTTPTLGWLEERLEGQGSSIDLVVQHAQERQGASNVSVRNVITSMRTISELDWADLFESVSPVDAVLRLHPGYGAMDFASRNQYRTAVEGFARRGTLSETEVAADAIEAARAVQAGISDAEPDRRACDPGWHLLAEGRPALAARVGLRPGRWRRFGYRPGLRLYAGAIFALTLALVAVSGLALSASGAPVGLLVLWALAALIPASTVAQAFVDRAVGWMVHAVPLPGLALEGGVPSALRTMVVVPTLLSDAADLTAQIEALEVHHLSGAGGDMSFALLTDGKDAPEQEMPQDAALLALARDGIAALNRTYAPGPGGPLFLHLHRRRLFNPAEGVWMGWERKRGKLHELNRLLRGAVDTGYIDEDGLSPSVPEDVRYVITLDSDTRMPRDAAIRLIGKIAHPLNRAVFDPLCQRVIAGHAILQPRVTPEIAVGRRASAYLAATSGPGGMDPYAAASSDIYQDLFGEGSFTGKGIYEIDTFEAAMAGRVPENALLSHDLLEGIFARAGLASDIEVVEAFPDRYDIAARRTHRWSRGDWQLLPWLGALPALGRIKVLDTLRRSALAPMALATLVLGWMLPWPAAVVATLMVMVALALPASVQAVMGVMPRLSAGLHLRNHMRRSARDIALAALQVALTFAFLADTADRMADAIVRTLWRMGVSRRHLLEWTTAAQASASARLGFAGFVRWMMPGMLLGLVAAALAFAVSPTSWALILPFAVLWLAAPVIALRVSRAPKPAADAALRGEDADVLRLIARRTWRYFETYVTAEQHHLPPDNVQEVPRQAVAHRTSPTNIGLYLLSAIVARDFGWAGTRQTAERLQATLDTMRTLPRFRGHFYNWYDTDDLRVLDPPYVSSVDSGNLAGHLIALANAVEEWAEDTTPGPMVAGLTDAITLARGDLTAASDPAIAELLDSLAAGLATPVLSWAQMQRLAAKAEALDTASPSWLTALRQGIEAHAADDAMDSGVRAGQSDQLRAIGHTARAMAMEMDFAFLLDPERKLLSIGYSGHENALDPGCFDLLASEARLASLFAVAKGDAPLRHWFRLGRAATPLPGGAGLMSWSGSMFEYLMPALVMHEAEGSLLGRTNRLVVARQQAYGAAHNVPWGISESGFNARDIELTYQYSNFGVPGLGLKRGLASNLVIAPYATGLAAMIDPGAARRNYDLLESFGALGRYGFHEALDFTPSRVLPGDNVAVVKSYMAHHQGMTIVAIANALQDGRMRDRFHAEPIIAASELLLQERIPRDVTRLVPRADEAVTRAAPMADDVPRVRRIEGMPEGPPVTHLMSNGRYAVMLTASGAGYSRWGEIAVTRWQSDATRDDQGAILQMRDLGDDRHWAFGAVAADHAPDACDVQFHEDHTTFARRDGGIASMLDVVVSGEDDAEVRRLSLTNMTRRDREIEVTSYCELALTTPASDAAHPAFARMFVQTDYLPEFGALIAWRRPRTPDEPTVWAAHFVVVDGEATELLQYDTDRAACLGRDQRASHACPCSSAPLSGRLGTVLDPVFALRQRVRIAPGKTAQLMFWTLVAATRDELIDLIDRHHDRNSHDRARTLAWTQAQVQQRHLGITSGEAADFQRLAAPLLYPDARFRAPANVLVQGAGPQSGLWPMAISGDLPIVLLRIDDIADVAQVRALLQAHEYWRMKQLAVDLVILNEHPASYAQELQSAIETQLRSSHSRPRPDQELAKGTVTMLRADLIPSEARALLLSVARVVLMARRGAIGDQLAVLLAAPQALAPRLNPPSHPKRPAVALADPGEGLEFFNGLGGFARDGREYVVTLDEGDSTPAPWINVIANAGFGFQVSATGSGFVWAENSRDNQLTPWSNDAVADPAGEAFYIRDEDTGEVFSPTASPLRDAGRYTARHGFGYSRFQHTVAGLACDLVQFVPLEDPVKISRLRLTNLGGRARTLSVATYAEPVMGTSRAASAPFIVTARLGAALLARNPWNTSFPGRVLFSDLNGAATGWTGDRTEFLGQGCCRGAPLAMTSGATLSGRTGAGLDPCLALTRLVTLAPGESVEVTHFLGQSATEEAAAALLLRLHAADLDQLFAEVETHWAEALGAVQVQTPDRAMDIMVNGWLLYQTIACRILARSAFYQASGAYGFRDQLQDGMALTFSQPERTRAHLLRAAGRQFREGDVQHWWLPHSGQGVRTRISDDVVWLGHAVAAYVATTGDAAVLDEPVAFLDGPALAAGEHDAFFLPDRSAEEATLFDHCVLALDRCLDMAGPLGLPLIGAGDWNDGMNRVGAEGRGESVWLGWFLLRTLADFAPLVEARAPEVAARWKIDAEALRMAIETEAWDGAWYRRATFDDGTWLGTATGTACHIDSIAQSWAVLSGAADPERAARAMESFDSYLMRRDEGLALLFTPPFDGGTPDPGYIAAYPPGLRENGGQYTHAALWAILAWTELGQGDKAAELFATLNPINHALTPAQTGRYKVEPYVIAADVYSVAPNVGRGGWTWYTGSGAWMQRAGVEGILGLNRRGDHLSVRPCLPTDWPGYSARITVAGTQIEIRVTQGDSAPHTVLDGKDLPFGAAAQVPLDGQPHSLVLHLQLASR